MTFSRSDVLPELVNGKEVTLSDVEKDAIVKEWNKNLVNEVDLALGVLRKKRNILLAETDYLALSDNTLSDDMKKYRQDLRDLPAGKDTVEKCENAIFPTKP